MWIHNIRDLHNYYTKTCSINWRDYDKSNRDSTTIINTTFREHSRNTLFNISIDLVTDLEKFTIEVKGEKKDQKEQGNTRD